MTISKLINHFATIPSEIILAWYNRENNDVETYRFAPDINDEKNKKTYDLFLKAVNKWKVYDWKVIKKSSGVSLRIYINKPTRR